MPNRSRSKPLSKASSRSLPKVDELANYLVTEAEREVTKPDKPTREQLSLIMTSAAQNRSKKRGQKHRKKRRSRRAPGRKAGKPRRSAARAAVRRRGRKPK